MEKQEKPTESESNISCADKQCPIHGELRSRGRKFMGYVVSKNEVYGKKWEFSYKSLIYSTDKTATLILVDLLRDDNLYVRAFTAKALGFIGDKRALDELKRVAEKDKSSRVRSRAKWAYEQIAGGKPLAEEKAE